MNDKNIKAIMDSLKSIGHLTKDINNLLLCPNPNVIKGPTNITQDEIVDTYTYNNYIRTHLTLISNHIPDIMNELKEYQNAEVNKGSKEEER